MSVVNFNDTTPAPPANFTNIKWLSDASGNISGNLSLSPSVTTISADYTVLPSDQLIAITGGANVYLTASPVPNQIVAIKNFTTSQITINGNGHNVAGTPTVTIYPVQFNQYWFNPASNAWSVLNPTSSGWMSWAPTFSAAGAMTVTGVSITDAQWLWLNVGTILVKSVALFTLGGTASANVLFTAPILVVGTTLPILCWVQEPGQATLNTQYYMRTDPTNGFFLRRPDGAAFTLGNYQIQMEGYYRIV